MKKYIALMLAFFVIAAPAAFASDDITLYHYADFLDYLGIMTGSESGYETEKELTRSEGIALIVRLLGKESEALSSSGETPFSDKGWADKYILYAYSNRLVRGKNDKEFGINDILTSKQFSALILRCLGYTDGEDFLYENADGFLEELMGTTFDTENFTRGDAAKLCYYALLTKAKGMDKTLLEISGIDEEKAKTAVNKISRNTRQSGSTNVFVYMVASDLESLLGRATDDLSEMLSSKIGKNTNLYIMAGGAKNWRNDYIKEPLGIYKAADKKIELIESLPNDKISSADTLTKFIEKCIGITQCDRNILIMWDHGEGTIGGFGKDELNNDKALSIEEIKRGIENSGVYFDIIGFDACLMGTAEVVFGLSNVCSYLIASQELEPTCGWYYTTWLDTIENNPNIDLILISKMIVDSAIVHSSIETNSDAVLAVIDASKGHEIAESIEQSLKDNKELNIQDLRSSENGQKKYDQFDVSEFFANDMNITNTVNKTVIYKRLSAPFAKLSGISFYYPKDALDKYEDTKNMLINIGYDNKYFEYLRKGD